MLFVFETVWANYIIQEVCGLFVIEPLHRIFFTENSVIVFYKEIEYPVTSGILRDEKQFVPELVFYKKIEYPVTPGISRNEKQFVPESRCTRNCSNPETLVPMGFDSV